MACFVKFDWLKEAIMLCVQVSMFVTEIRMKLCLIIPKIKFFSKNSNIFHSLENIFVKLTQFQ